MTMRPFACRRRLQREDRWTRERRIGVPAERSTRRLYPVMADAPRAVVGITEQRRGREEEPAPAPHPQRGIVAVHVAQNAFDLVAARIEVGEPFKPGARKMRP